MYWSWPQVMDFFEAAGKSNWRWYLTAAWALALVLMLVLARILSRYSH